MASMEMHALALLRDFLAVSTALPPADAAPPAGSAWEAAGCELWDMAASSDCAILLMDHGLPGILQTLLRAVLSRPLDPTGARCAEICLGILANLASHAQLHAVLLQQEGLAALVVGQGLWEDDAAVLTEGCRLASGLLLSCKPERDWCQLLASEEALGRLAWVLENTLHSSLLERALELLAALLTALNDQVETALPKLLQLDLLPLLTSVAAAWVERLRKEDEEFDGRGAAVSAASEASSVTATGTQAAAGQGQQPGLVQPQAEKPGAPGQARAAVAAEVSSTVLAEALHLLNIVACVQSGCAALSDSEQARAALVQLLAASDDMQMQLATLTVLASIDNSEQQLLRSRAALAKVLGVLAVAGSSVEVGSDEAEAAWSLVSSVVRQLAAQARPAVAPVLEQLCLEVKMLMQPAWAANCRTAQHQQYVAAQLQRLLAGSANPAQQQALEALNECLSKHWK